MTHKTTITFSDRTWHQVEELLENYGFQNAKEVVMIAVHHLLKHEKEWREIQEKHKNNLDDKESPR